MKQQTLGSVLFVKDGDKYDYCYRESLRCLLDLSDQVVVVCVESEDDTIRECEKICISHMCNSHVIKIDRELWDATKDSGKLRLSFFSNIGIANLYTDWVYYAQADEITDEDSFAQIREAINSPGRNESYMVRRINLWNTPYQELIADNPPCSNYVIRLSRNKPNVRCVGDAESLAVENMSYNYMDKIIVWHMGFVRDRKIMVNKVKELQQGVFNMADYDKRLDAGEEFRPLDYFREDQLRPIHKPLPKYVQRWAEVRMLKE